MATPSSFPIVGIGASAGGIEALAGLFRELPADCGCGLIIVTHLNPERHSLLPEVVGRMTTMPVNVATDGAIVEVNTVYVLPADAVLELEGGALRVHRPTARRPERKPIDVFLSSLALDQGEKAVGIILSGGDGDGTLGVKAIKERSGFTLAQVADGSPPLNPEMPQSAIASGNVDLAIPVEEMGPRLVAFARSRAMLLDIADEAQRTDAERQAEKSRPEICAILRNQVGHDFSGYKQKTFLRRVERRMQVNRLEAVEDYLELLRRDPKEVGALFRDLLINVTNFFRDADAFKILETQVIPKLFVGRGADDTVRVWVPGCATGEEVFSIAILMREHMDTLTAVPKVQIFATDIDDAALGVARAGRYPEALLDSVSASRRKRFFVQEDRSFLLTKEVRDLCVFSPHSVIRDPPFSRLDLISCRNLLIYFGPDVQNQVIPTFHYALRPGGYLFLGTSENVTQFGDLFVPLDKKYRVFRSREDAASAVRVPMTVAGLKPARFAAARPAGLRSLGGVALRQTAETYILERFAPAYVLVNHDGDVVYYSAGTGKYLEATAGAPSRQLLQMARKGLHLELRAVFREVVETDRRVLRESVAVETDASHVQRINLSAEPIGEPGDDRLFVIVFEAVGRVVERDQAGDMPGPQDAASAHLERELRETRERLQSVIEEYETALEELKSSNEELVSVNEELQSTNEELEASKEELQSLNEELHTVNGELHAKIEQLDRANTDLANLFESTRVATVFLNRDLVIRSFTPAVTQIFNILPTDRGRPLTDLVSRVDLPTLTDDVRGVFSTGQTVERTLDHNNGAAHFLLRLVPYLDADQMIEGVVMTLVDITSLTAAEAHQKVLIDELNHRVRNMLTVVISVAEQTYRTSVDPKDFKNRFVDRIYAMAKSYELLSREHWTEASLKDLIAPHVTPFGPERVRMNGPEVRLKPAQALSLGMIVHELATNAGKYGALSIGDGSVEVSWREVSNDNLVHVEFEWSERDGPQVQAVSKRGFGLKLVEREARGMGGRAEVNLEASGLKAQIVFPRGE